MNLETTNEYIKTGYDSILQKSIPTFVKDLTLDLLKANINEVIFFDPSFRVGTNYSEGNEAEPVFFGNDTFLSYSFNWYLIDGRFVVTTEKIEINFVDGSNFDLKDNNEIGLLLINHIFEDYLNKDYENTCNVCDEEIGVDLQICDSKSCFKADAR